MSWSVSATAPRDEALKQVREQFARCTYLPPGEGARGEKLLDTIEKFAFKSVESTDVLKISAWGSESIVHGATAEEPRVTSIQGGYTVTVERADAPIFSGVATAAA